MADEGPTDNVSPRQKTTPMIVSAARWLFFLLGVIWLAFGISSIARFSDNSGSVPSAVLWIIAILMFVNALLLFWIGWGIGSCNRIYFYFGLLILAGNIFLTFTDEFGIFDLVTLIINIVLLILLIAGHSKFLEN